MGSCTIAHIAEISRTDGQMNFTRHKHRPYQSTDANGAKADGTTFGRRPTLLCACSHRGKQMCLGALSNARYQSDE